MHVMVGGGVIGQSEKKSRENVLLQQTGARESGIVKKSNGKEIIILFIGHSGTKLSKNAFLNVFAHQQV